MEELQGGRKTTLSADYAVRWRSSPYHQLLGLEAVSERDRLGNLMSPDAARVQAGRG